MNNTIRIRAEYELTHMQSVPFRAKHGPGTFNGSAIVTTCEPDASMVWVAPVEGFQQGYLCGVSIQDQYRADVCCNQETNSWCEHGHVPTHERHTRHG